MNEEIKTISINVKHVNENSNIPLPTYGSALAAGADLHAANTEPITIEPRSVKLIPTGLAFAIPEGFEMQIRPRSGLALKKTITVLNTPGTIDADYRNEVGVILINHGKEDFIVNPLERIAQAVIARFYKAEFVPVKELDETARGMGGFGSTGTHHLK